MAEYMQSYANPQWRHDVGANLDRLNDLLNILETTDDITEDNPCFNMMCEFTEELTSIVQNLNSLIPR